MLDCVPFPKWSWTSCCPQIPNRCFRNLIARRYTDEKQTCGYTRQLCPTKIVCSVTSPDQLLTPVQCPGSWRSSGGDTTLNSQNSLFCIILLHAACLKRLPENTWHGVVRPVYSVPRRPLVPTTKWWSETGSTGLVDGKRSAEFGWSRFGEEKLIKLRVCWLEESGSLTDKNPSQSATFVASSSSYHHHHLTRVLWSSSACTRGSGDWFPGPLTGAI